MGGDGCADLPRHRHFDDMGAAGVTTGLQRRIAHQFEIEG
jgi:hypothetical protein